MKILIVEDNDLNADMLGRRLERVGHEVTWLPSAEEALARIPEAEADLVLLDIRLPGMSGIDLVRQVRRSQNCRELPFIAVTGDALPEVLDEALEAGCCACVTKPIDFDGLVQRIEWAISGQCDGCALAGS